MSGRADRGLNFFVQTIVCRDSKALFDAVTRVKVPDDRGLGKKTLGLGAGGFSPSRPSPSAPPTFEAMLNRLPFRGVKRFRWIPYKLRCPVSPIHRVDAWNEPDKCPRCGVFLERNALPFRIWD